MAKGGRRGRKIEQHPLTEQNGERQGTSHTALKFDYRADETDAIMHITLSLLESSVSSQQSKPATHALPKDNTIPNQSMNQSHGESGGEEAL